MQPMNRTFFNNGKRTQMKRPALAGVVGTISPILQLWQHLVFIFEAAFIIRFPVLSFYLSL